MAYEVLIQSVWRSGGTMLAGLMTTEKHTLLNEPYSFPPPNPFSGVSWDPNKPWGVKACIPAQIPLIPAKHTYALVRNPEQIVRSMAEKELRFGRSLDHCFGFPLVSCLEMFNRMEGLPVIRYEDIVNGKCPEIPGWELTGDTDFWIRRARLGHKRQFEIDRHGTKPNSISAKRMFKSQVEEFAADPRVRSFVRAYSKRYDY